MHELDFADWGAIAALIGFIIFYVSCAFRGVWWPPIEKVVESLGFAAGVPVGVRMICAAFNPKMLCCLIDENKHQVLNSTMQLSFEEHKAEIVIGGVCIILTSIYSYGWLIRRPVHHEQP